MFFSSAFTVTVDLWFKYFTWKDIKFKQKLSLNNYQYYTVY